MANPISGSATLRVHGVKLPPGTQPAFLQNARRSTGGLNADEVFLPRNWVQVEEVVDLSSTARSSAAGAEQDVDAREGQVLVLELQDGVTLITSPSRLKETLANIDPASQDAKGPIRLDEALKSRGPAVRGFWSDIGDGLQGIVSRIFTLTVGAVADPIIEQAKRKASEWLGETAEDKIQEYAELGVSWLGTKALMWAIEQRLDRAPGLYRWNDRGLGERYEGKEPRLAQDAQQGPLLVFLHGTGSSTTGSFSDLQSGGAQGLWGQLEARYGERIFSLEHRTLSESPIDNALQLARALPAGAQVHLVSHSRGGLVGDLLCLDSFDDCIEGYALDDSKVLGIPDEAERENVFAELKIAHAEQRRALHDLQAELRSKQLRVERYVRVAAPSRGTRLASANFDAFLSGLLTLIGWVPALAGQPLYAAFKRVVLEIVRNRTRANLVPGIEAMLPESPMGRFLLKARPRPELRLGIVAGDLQRGNPLKWLGTLFTDHLFFDGMDNDLVVDTDSMYAGLARHGQALALFDQGAGVTHFNYFANERTRQGLCDWLLTGNPLDAPSFKPLPGVQPEISLEDEEAQAKRAVRSRGRDPENDTLPVVILLPGIMGSHLWKNGKDRVWFDPFDLALGGLRKIAWGAPGIEAEKLHTASYKSLSDHLQETHRVVRFAYDWRQPLDTLAEAFAGRLRKVLDSVRGTRLPVRVIAHSMGGLVVRALMHHPQHRALWVELMEREDARFVMLGTPNNGSFSMVATLLGKDDSVRKLGVADIKHSMQGVLDLVAEFRGALQLLPRSGFKEVTDVVTPDYFKPDVWTQFKARIKDAWFGDGVCAQPRAEALDAANWLWAQADEPLKAYSAKTYYVCGQAEATPCGVVEENGRIRLLASAKGDGTVTWESGRQLAGITPEHTFWMRARHGDMCDTEEYFDSLTMLLEHGKPGELLTTAPAVSPALSFRSAGHDAARDMDAIVRYDAGPVPYPTDAELAAGLFGGSTRSRQRAPQGEVLKVQVCAMDLRSATHPVLLGHFDEDPIAGAESEVDRHLVDGELRVRHHLGLYAGRIGTASAVLLACNEQERARGNYRGAVITGLGKYDGNLGVADLTNAVRTGALRYLLHMKELLDFGSDGEINPDLPLSALLIGYNSSVNISIVDSVSALLRGVLDANLKFREQTGSPLRIGSLHLIELFLDTAITAAHALRGIAQSLNADPKIGTRVQAERALLRGEGARPRLEDSRSASYWPRLIVTDADRPDTGCPPECVSEEPPSAKVQRQGRDGGPTPCASQPVFAEKLRFLYLGQRARAETTLQRRQPGMVEAFVERQVRQSAYNADFGRTLFQLLIPQELKDAARQMNQVILVLDRYTADLPWELMLADEQPLATKVAMIRQLSTARFRAKVNQTQESRALVIGNPSTANFGRVFVDKDCKPQKELDRLPGAEAEATRVADVLSGNGYAVRRLIGSDTQALDAVTALYRDPFRIIHIAAHGVHEEMAADGRPRSGVVLSDGQLLTAAEIGAMETVPDLVFLNCCHLAKQTGASTYVPGGFNRFAYSVSRELIDMGVRAVIAAGWAVGDESGQFFAETFYQALLRDKLSFGKAVFTARQETWRRYPGDATWGAYQAYGDPGWAVNARDTALFRPTPGTFDPVAPEELLARIEAMRFENRTASPLSASDQRRADEAVQECLRSSSAISPDDPAVLARLGEFYADLGPAYAARACTYFRQAIAAEDARGAVAIRSVEQLALLESRGGEPVNRSPGKEADPYYDLEAIDRAIGRITALTRITGPDSAGVSANAERFDVLASALKSRAVVHAHQIVVDQNPGADGDMRKALEDAAKAYARHATLKAGEAIGNLRATLNHVLLVPFLGAQPVTETPRSVARGCIAAARTAFGESPVFSSAILMADALLASALLDGSLSAADGKNAAGEAALESVKQAYRDARHGRIVRERELEAVIRQVLLFARFYAAGAQSRENAGDALIARRLIELAESIRPGSSAAISDFVRRLDPAPN